MVPLCALVGCHPRPDDRRAPVNLRMYALGFATAPSTRVRRREHGHALVIAGVAPDALLT